MRAALQSRSLAAQQAALALECLVVSENRRSTAPLQQERAASDTYVNLSQDHLADGKAESLNPVNKIWVQASAINRLELHKNLFSKSRRRCNV